MISLLEIRETLSPNFPRPPPASVDPATIWAYATRELTGLTGTPRTDLMGEDASFEAGAGARKGKIDNVDATITSRAPSGEYDTELDATISSRASHAAADIWSVGTRELSGFTGAPRTDLIGENASFEASTGRAASIPRLDNIPTLETPVEASIAMTGSEVTLVEKTDSKFGYLDGYVDLSTMQSGDTIVVREFMQVKSAGAYVKYAEESYSDAQTIPLLHLTTKPARYKIKVTAEQTVGTNRTLDVEFYRRVVA